MAISSPFSLVVVRARPLLGVWAMLAALLPCLPAAAMPGAAINQYRAPASLDDDLAAERPEVGEHLRLHTHLSLDYANHPLVYETKLGVESSRGVSLVSDHLTAQLGAAFGLFGRLLVFTALPVHLVMEGTPLGTQPTATGFGVGDLALGARVMLLRGAAGALGVQLAASFPTGTDNKSTPAVAGDPTVVGLPSMLAELDMGPVRLDANVGLRLHSAFSLPGIQLSSQLAYAAALSVPFGSRVRASLEAFGSTLTADAGKRQTSMLEALLGLKLQVSDDVSIGLAGTKGILQGYGSPDWRLIAQLGWQFRFQREAPVETAAAEPEERPEVVVPLAASVAVDETAEEAVVDTDKDGTADNEDHCPVLAGPTELAGCPEHVSYDKTTGAITLSPAPGFVRASERLDTRSLTALESLARALSIGGKQRLLISVHLDPRSKPDLTFRTEERARVLMEYLIGRGVPAQKLDVWACAGNTPRVTSRRFESANERAEFFLTLPLPEQGMPSSVGCNAVDLPP